MSASISIKSDAVAHPCSDSDANNVESPSLAPATWQVEVFYDGDCPLCMREIAMLMRRDRNHDRIRFTNIAAADFEPSSYGESSRMFFMDRIRGRLPDGSWIEGVEVFRRLYGAIGFRWLIPVTRLPGISHLLSWGYTIFAKNRLKWTGRCDDGACALPTPTSK